MTFGYMATMFIFIGRMPFLAPTLDNADPLALHHGDTPAFYSVFWIIIILKENIN